MRLFLTSLICFVAAFFVCPSHLFAQAGSSSVATAYSVEGVVQVKRSNASDWVAVAKGASFQPDDLVQTGERARVGLRFVDGKLVRLGENSQIRIIPPQDQKQEQGRIGLVGGIMHLFNRHENEVPVVETQEVSAAIRGTEVVFERRNPGTTTVNVITGLVDLENSFGALSLAHGESGLVKEGKAPVRSLAVKPADAVEWAMYFPYLASPQEFAGLRDGLSDNEQEWIEKLPTSGEPVSPNVFAGNTWQSALARSLAYAKNRDGAQSFSALGDFREPPIFLQRASLELASGRVEVAQALLTELLQSLTSNSSESANRTSASALDRLALISIVKNSVDTAQDQLDKSELLAPASDIHELVRSYVAQAQGDIETAESSVKRALELSENNSFYLARLAELQMGQGRVREASETAKRAQEGASNDPYVIATYGFSQLALYEPQVAKQAFERALELDEGYGMAQFGLGMALINSGELAEGRERLEKAVHLEPTKGLFRSYLGKAFFEELSEEKADDEYALAIELDPNDPTPYLYRAFNKLSQNRPVNALEDIERSIERNDARAVYRSRMLLDQDEAVRTTSLAEVYSQLGFSQVAQIEARKSVNKDYGNYSAHRLLSNTFTGDFFSDAQFSESLIADLLSPVSFNSFQSFNGFRPEASLNEYSALFDRPGYRTEVNSSYLTQEDIWDSSVLQTGKIQDFGYRVSAADSYARGEKSNGDFGREHRFDIAGQYQPNYENRFLVRSGYGRREDRTTVDGSKFDDFDIGVGSFHRLAPNTKLINFVEYFDRSLKTGTDFVDEDASQVVVRGGMPLQSDDISLALDQETDEDFHSIRGSSQIIHQEDFASFVAGFEYVYFDGDGDERSIIIGDDLDFFTDLLRRRDTRGEYNTNSVSGYAYSTWHINSWMDVDFGLNYSVVEMPEYDVIAPFVDGERSESRLSPKAGLTFYPTDDLTIRSAYYRDLGIGNISDIGSIEPTLVGSFNQVFGDLPGAKTENYSIGADYKWPSSAYAGLEYTYRDIARSAPVYETLFTVDLDDLTDSQSLSRMIAAESEREHLIHSYLYKVLTEDLVGTLDYNRTLLEAVDIDEKNEVDQID
ncbi:MAG: tetratricopeptide repeat protein, partial [Bdellovibrionales bacterium]|nr:tetratricopeptide repeat protein [Bdellovibrionales bacterium]